MCSTATDPDGTRIGNTATEMANVMLFSQPIRYRLRSDCVLHGLMRSPMLVDYHKRSMASEIGGE